MAKKQDGVTLEALAIDVGMIAFLVGGPAAEGTADTLLALARSAYAKSLRVPELLGGPDRLRPDAIQHRLRVALLQLERAVDATGNVPRATARDVQHAADLLTSMADETTGKPTLRRHDPKVIAKQISAVPACRTQAELAKAIGVPVSYIVLHRDEGWMYEPLSKYHPDVLRSLSKGRGKQKRPKPKLAYKGTRPR